MPRLGHPRLMLLGLLRQVRRMLERPVLLAGLMHLVHLSQTHLMRPRHVRLTLLVKPLRLALLRVVRRLDPGPPVLRVLLHLRPLHLELVRPRVALRLHLLHLRTVLRLDLYPLQLQRIRLRSLPALALQLLQLLLQLHHLDRIAALNDKPLAILVPRQPEQLLRHLLEIRLLRRHRTKHRPQRLRHVQQVLHLQRRVGRANPHIHPRRQFLVQQLIRDLIEAVFLEELGILARQREDHRIGLVRLFQLHQLPDQRLDEALRKHPQLILVHPRRNARHQVHPGRRLLLDLRRLHAAVAERPSQFVPVQIDPVLLRIRTRIRRRRAVPGHDVVRDRLVLRRRHQHNLTRRKRP